MEIIRLLGEKIAELINISPPAARGLLRLAVIDELGPFKPIKQLNFTELKTVIQNSLKKRLIKLEIENYEIITEKLVSILIENQSLITMGAI